MFALLIIFFIIFGFIRIWDIIITERNKEWDMEMTIKQGQALIASGYFDREMERLGIEVAQYGWKGELRKWD